MIHDSVREELALKISPITKVVRKPVEDKFVQEEPAEEFKRSLPVEPVKTAPVIEVSDICLPTMEIMAKPTSPILVEFQNKNAVIPEWRLQLQNSVRRRHSGGQPENLPTIPQKVLVTNGATALKVEQVEQTAVAVAANPTLEKAMQRIEQSRQKYLAEEKSKLAAVPTQQKSFPHAVPNKPQSFPPNRFQESAKPVAEPKPKAPFSFSQTTPKFEKFDTNKLPPLPLIVSSSFEKTIEIPSTETKIEKESFLQIKADETPEVMAYTETVIDGMESPIVPLEAEMEGDDRAPMMMRFNAGFFDLIIGAFTSFILLAPFSLASGNLFTFQGVLAFLATCSIVMFIYLTATIGTMGRTFGMKLFSLEIIDIEENAYPSFHQAAVNSSVYLVSLALGGIGFLTLFLNDEKRAAHDLISGTIVVKEYE